MCTGATVRSHRLAPGEQTRLDVTFYTRVDGPGRHGEGIRLFTNDSQTTRRARLRPLASEVAFFISVRSR